MFSTNNLSSGSSLIRFKLISEKILHSGDSLVFSLGTFGDIVFPSLFTCIQESNKSRAFGDELRSDRIQTFEFNRFDGIENGTFRIQTKGLKVLDFFLVSLKGKYACSGVHTLNIVEVPSCIYAKVKFDGIVRGSGNLAKVDGLGAIFVKGDNLAVKTGENNTINIANCISSIDDVLALQIVTVGSNGTEINVNQIFFIGLGERRHLCEHSLFTKEDNVSLNRILTFFSFFVQTALFACEGFSSLSGVVANGEEMTTRKVESSGKVRTINQFALVVLRQILTDRESGVLHLLIIDREFLFVGRTQESQVAARDSQNGLAGTDDITEREVTGNHRNTGITNGDSLVEGSRIGILFTENNLIQGHSLRLNTFTEGQNISAITAQDNGSLAITNGQTFNLGLGSRQSIITFNIDSANSDDLILPQRLDLLVSLRSKEING